MKIYCILETCIQWTQHDKFDGHLDIISDIILRNFLFNHVSVFHLFGTATFQRCLVHGEPFLIYLHKNSIESRIPVKKISSYSMAHSLNLFGTKFEMISPGWGYDDDRGFHIRTMDCVRGIIIRNCTFFKIWDGHFNDIYFNLGDKSSNSSSDRNYCNNSINP